MPGREELLDGSGSPSERRRAVDRMSWLGLEYKVAVVTGAGRGIGAAIALELARNGARVAVFDINLRSAEAIAKEATAVGAEAFAVRMDVSDENSVAAAADAVIDRWERVDVLVNNAGISGAGALADISAAEWERVLDINLSGYLRCAQRFGARMRQQSSGSIIHVSSIAGINPQARSGSYSPSKAAVAMLARVLALEWGPDGVRSNAVAPGMTLTPMGEEIYRVPGVLEARSAAVPLGRIGAPQDIADICCWLASERASYVTGEEIVVDGGFGQTLMSHVPRPGH
jgi:NAD(P)-dependent dehydrogenase (short-subunit alcohol dehydrogenase family)